MAKFDIGSLNRGKALPKTVRDKISQRLKGRVAWNKGLRGSTGGWNKGIKWSKKTKQLISKNRRGKPPWNKGLHLSINHREKIRRAKIGEVPSASGWNKGRKATEEERTHLREAWEKRKAQNHSRGNLL